MFYQLPFSNSKTFPRNKDMVHIMDQKDTIDQVNGSSGRPRNPDNNTIYHNVETMSMGVFVILFFLGSLFNILVLRVFMKSTLYKSPSNLQLFSLVLDDLGTSILVEPLVVLSYLRPSIFLRSTWLCRYFSSVLHIFPWGSTISLLILSVTRIFIFRRPLMYRSYVTCTRVTAALCIKYIVLCTFVGISNFFWVTRFNMQYKQCFASYARSGTGDSVRNSSGRGADGGGDREGVASGGRIAEHFKDSPTMPSLHVAGGLVIFLINIVIVMYLVRTRVRKIARAHSTRITKAAVELVLLVFVYMITTVLVPIIFFSQKAGVNLTAGQSAITGCVAKILFYMQPIVNPLIYVVRRTEYQMNLKRAVTTAVLRKKAKVHDALSASPRKFYQTARMVMNANMFIIQLQKLHIHQNGEDMNNGRDQNKGIG